MHSLDYRRILEGVRSLRTKVWVRYNPTAKLRSVRLLQAG